MAVKINFETKMGVEGDYVNIVPQIVNKTKININVNYWKDQATRNIDGALPLSDQMAGLSDERITGFKCRYVCDYDLDSVKNVFQQAYDYLKTLPEFADAIDDITEEQSSQLEAVNNVQLNIRPIS